MTYDEAQKAAGDAVRGSCTVHEIRQRLKTAGFDGDAAEINFRRSPTFEATIRVPGPQGKTLFACVA